MISDHLKAFLVYLPIRILVITFANLSLVYIIFCLFNALVRCLVLLRCKVLILTLVSLKFFLPLRALLAQKDSQNPNFVFYINYLLHPVQIPWLVLVLFKLL